MEPGPVDAGPVDPAPDGAESWDLVVVGAGPAGSTTALAALDADPGLRVLLLDRADFPRDKSCGDGIAPHVFAALAEVGVHGVEDGWAPIPTLELTRGDQVTRGTMQRPARVIPRRVLDARLVERAVAAGAVLRRHRVRTCVPGPDAVVLDGTLRARVVVGADGAHSVVRAALGRPRPLRKALAIRGYAPTPPGAAGVQSIVFGDRRQPSYAWAFDRGDGTSNVGYGELVTDGADHPTRRLMLEELERLVPGSASGGTGWLAHPLPLSGRRLDVSDPRTLLVGDARHLINPLTGEGIYYAVVTGIAAGRAAAHAVRSGDPALAGPAFDRAVGDHLRVHLRHTWAAAGLSRAPGVLDAGLRAAAADRRSFDALVELGLGSGRLTPRLAAGLASGWARTLVGG